MENDAFFDQVLRYHLGTSASSLKAQMKGGGSINSAARITSKLGDHFVKWNRKEVADMFEKEAKGLGLLHNTNTIKVPEILGYGETEDRSYLLLKYVEEGRADEKYWTNMGESLAALHLSPQENFGLDHNNYIGTLEQINNSSEDWCDFFTNQRLRPQIQLVTSLLPLGFLKRFEAFLDRLPDVMPASEPSLLHGDLWNGNVLPAPGGEACFFDPAVYCGAREMDLAMTRLFGGFDKRFYEAYHAVYSLPQDFDKLVDVYNLYPLMVHVNLFGINSGYLGSVERIIDRYL